MIWRSRSNAWRSSAAGGDALRKIDSQKQELNVRAKKILRAALNRKTWEEKLAAIERMNAASKRARAAMRRSKVPKTSAKISSERS